ncbi:MAG: XrtA system polysaccharide deacetylase [Bryobacteraceae bacterium]
MLSIDVEDWFHILDLRTTPSLETWDVLPSRVERNFNVLLDLLAEHDTHATCFFLGWVARKYPWLVRRAHDLGHEVASHGYSHQLAYTMTPSQFYMDAKEAKNAIEDAGGREVVGYRASGFSMTHETRWMFEMLAQAGYRYDSSIFPANRGHGGFPGAFAPYRVHTAAGDLVEFPVSVTAIFRKPVCLFGGGYLRLFPWFLIRRAAQAVLRQDRPAVFYIHPREIDPDQPRLPMPIIRSFKCYVNLHTTEAKLCRLLQEFEFKTFQHLFTTVSDTCAGASAAA